MTVFTIAAREGAARAGVLRTAHGEIPTPAFMPVGTKATVKTVDPDELRALGTNVLLGNTYHLHFRPGEDLIAELGGLHRFMGWDGPILTDSGGFQVFSLRDTIVATDDDGVTFRSVYDGAPARFTPELVAGTEVQVVRVAEEHLRPERGQLVRVDGLHRSLRPDRHEDGRPHLAVGGAQDTGTRRAVRCGHVEVTHPTGRSYSA